LELSRTTWLVTSLYLGRAGEDVKALCASRTPIAPGAGKGPEEAATSTGRHSGGRPRGVLDPSSADRERYREPRRRSSVDCCVSPVAACEDRQTRWRHTVVRTWFAYKRGEPRVCAMVRAPTPEEEGRRYRARTAASDWSDSKPAMGGRCFPISRLRLIANSTVWRW
jgi:transposase